jgi:NitT/TauT family transport system permease protein
LGNVAGIILGLFLAFFPILQRIAKPYIVACGAIPIFSIAPMMIIWFGIGFPAKVMMAFFSVFLVATVQAYTGAVEIEPDYLKLLKSMRASRRQIFFKVALPSSVSWVIASLKLTIGFSLLGAFIGEFISAERGLGYRILKEGGTYNIPGVLAALALIVFVAILLNEAVEMVSTRLRKSGFGRDIRDA